MRVAFDSRAATDPRGIGRYVRCLLEALRATAGGGMRFRLRYSGARAGASQRRRGLRPAGLLAAGAAAQRPAPAPPPWTWEDAARATWTVYAEAATLSP
jgi:hypothetical protein